MKAITLYQPWASLMARDIKRFETRSWRTSHYGPLLICSSAKKPDVETATSILRRASIAATGETYKRVLKMISDRRTWMISSTALAVVNLIGCIPGDTLSVSPLERELGFYGSNRFVWITDRPHRLAHPFRVTGRQRLFSIDLNEIPVDSMRELMTYEHDAGRDFPF
jgi:hypothetical protein